MHYHRNASRRLPSRQPIIGRQGGGARSAIDKASPEFYPPPLERSAEAEAARRVVPCAVTEGASADETIEAVLPYEDNYILRRRFAGAIPDRVTALSTGDLLHELEAAGLIQSSDQILDNAAARGRNIEAQRSSKTEDEAARELCETICAVVMGGHSVGDATTRGRRSQRRFARQV